MFEFFQNQKNNEELIRMAQQIENSFENFIDKGIEFSRLLRWLDAPRGKEDNVNDEDDNTSVSPDDDVISFDENQEKWHEKLPRKFGPRDYVKKDRYSDDEIRRFEEIADWGVILDGRLKDDDNFTKEYASQVRSFFSRVAEITTDVESSKRTKGSRVSKIIIGWLESLSIWTEPMSAQSFFYLDYTVSQTRMLLELYQPNANDDELTQRHLFSMGLKRLKISDTRFMKLLFSLAILPFDLAAIPFYQFWHLLEDRMTDINWIDPIKYSDVQNDLFNGAKFADSAYPNNSQKDYWKTVLTPYQVNCEKCGKIKGRFHLKDNFNGYVGCRDIGNSKEIIVGFAGTEICSLKNWKTNLIQYLGGRPVPYNQAIEIVEKIWEETRRDKGFKNVCIKVYGHSLGGGMMQYAVSNSSADNIYGFGYNSAGLAEENVKDFNGSNNYAIYHLYNPCDIVFILPGSVQLGGAIKFDKKTRFPISAHLMESVKTKIKKHNKIAKIK